MSHADRCMEKLFDEGTVLKKAIEWMGEGNDDLSLKTTAALIVANIARNGVYLSPFLISDHFLAFSVSTF